jgi:hypothetical protein
MFKQIKELPITKTFTSTELELIENSIMKNINQIKQNKDWVSSSNNQIETLEAILGKLNNDEIPNN